MSLLRFGLVIVLALCGGCVGGSSQRASDIQNLNGISDDISAVTMTDSHSRWTHDPNARSTLPRTYEVSDIR